MLKYYLLAIDNNCKKSITSLNNQVVNLPITLLPTLLQYLKYLSKKNINILNNEINTEHIECIICYETQQKCIKYCKCCQNIMCKTCYIKWQKCVNCENMLK